MTYQRDHCELQSENEGKGGLQGGSQSHKFGWGGSVRYKREKAFGKVSGGRR